jgi:hypothetical protein
LDEIIIPEQKDINFPEKMSIDWENAPKQEEQSIIDIEAPIGNLMDGIKEFFGTFFDNIYSFMGSILNYVREPDKIIVTDTLITEYYGKKTVKYRIKRKDNKIEITNES